MQPKYKHNLTVADDNIFRDQIISELKSADTWTTDWGFLAASSTRLRFSTVP